MTFRRRLALIEGTHNPSMAAISTTLAPWVTRYLVEQRKLGRMTPDTARKAGYRLGRLADNFGHRPINHLTRQAIERWLETLEHLAPGTRRLNLSTAGTFCRWLIYQGAIRKDPTVGIIIRKPRSVPRALNAGQIAQFIPTLPDDRARVIVILMLHLGLRACEVSRARAEDYDRRSDVLLVTGKGGHQRMVPVSGEASEVLDAFLARRGATAGPLIRSRNQPWKSLTAGTISTLVSRWMKQAGIKQFRFDGISGHALRHTAASDVLENCGDVVVVQEFLGHASLEQTRIYLRRANMGRLRQAVDGRHYLYGLASTGTECARGDPTVGEATALRGAGSRSACTLQAPDPTEGPG